VAREALVAADRQIANQARSRGVFESNRLNERLGDILAGGFPANDVGSPTWVAMARQIQQSRWAHLVFQLRPGAYNDETLIEFLSVEVAVEPSQERGGAGVGARVLIASGLLARANLRTVFRSRCRCLAMACSRLRAPRGPGPPPSARGSVASARS
jgi:hypothetical protein